jgi:DNA modification methylase
MGIEIKRETRNVHSLCANDLKWYDRSEKSQKGLVIDISDLGGLKRPELKGAIRVPLIIPNGTITDGVKLWEIAKANGQTEMEVDVIVNATEEDIPFLVNSLNKSRIKKIWEQCEEALFFLPPQQQGKSLGGKTRWEIAIELSGVDIGPTTLESYHDIKKFDEETNEQYELLKKIKGIGIAAGQEPMTIKEAGTVVKRHNNKKKLREKHPGKTIHVDDIYTDLIKDFHVWLQDNREPWLIEDESIQLVLCSPHYFNQRKYTEEVIEYKTQTLPEYLNDLLLAFAQAFLKLKPDGVLCVNIGDTHKIGENYMVQQRFCLMLAEKLGFKFIFKQIWCKKNGLAKGYDNRAPTYDYEEIFYFAKSEKYYFKPIEIQDLEKDIVVAYYSGRTNPDGSKTKDKWIVSKEYETFNQFIHQNHFEDIIITGTASAESRAIREKHKDKDGKPIKHPAVMPLVIPLYPILCFSKPGDIVFDPWVGTGTTLKVALATGRKARGTDLEARFVNIATQECQQIIDLFK